jgi:hypothetical protein
METSLDGFAVAAPQTMRVSAVVRDSVSDAASPVSVS